jgi:hypothetical protein
MLSDRDERVLLIGERLRRGRERLSARFVLGAEQCRPVHRRREKYSGDECRRRNESDTGFREIDRHRFGSCGAKGSSH